MKLFSASKQEFSPTPSSSRYKVVKTATLRSGSMYKGEGSAKELATHALDTFKSSMRQQFTIKDKFGRFVQATTIAGVGLGGAQLYANGLDAINAVRIAHQNPYGIPESVAKAALHGKQAQHINQLSHNMVRNALNNVANGDTSSAIKELEKLKLLPRHMAFQGLEKSQLYALEGLMQQPEIQAGTETFAAFRRPSTLFEDPHYFALGQEIAERNKRVKSAGVPEQNAATKEDIEDIKQMLKQHPATQPSAPKAPAEANTLPAPQPPAKLPAPPPDSFQTLPSDSMRPPQEVTEPQESSPVMGIFKRFKHWIDTAPSTQIDGDEPLPLPKDGSGQLIKATTESRSIQAFASENPILPDVAKPQDLGSENYPENCTPFVQYSHYTNSLLKPAQPTQEHMPTILIDAGHGGSDPGKVAGGVYEKELNLQNALQIRQALMAKGYNTRMTRTDDVRLPLGCINAITESYQPDALLSIHQNANNNSDVMGHEVYATFPPGEEMARYISDELGVYLPYSPNRGVHQANFRVTKFGNNPEKVPHVLAELGFMSNPTELDALQNTWRQKKSSQAIAGGIDEYFTLHPIPEHETTATTHP